MAWLAVLALGLYHGLNPAMGWPLAVANGLTERRGTAVLRTLLPLGGGHFAAMAVVLVPLAALGWYVQWERRDPADGGGNGAGLRDLPPGGATASAGAWRASRRRGWPGGPF